MQQLLTMARDQGLSDRAFRVLTRAVFQDAPASGWSVEHLAADMGCSTGSAAKVARELEGKGILHREFGHRGKGGGRGPKATWTFTI